MKRNLIYLWLLLSLTLVLGCREKEKIKLYTVFVDVFDMPKNANLSKRAEVKVYGSEVDFWADKNILKQGFTDGQNKYYITSESLQPDNNKYWIKVKYDSLNNFRYGKSSLGYVTAEFNFWSSKSKNEEINLRKLQVDLGTTPTKLQLRVFSNGTPVQGVKVFLYDSEVNYIGKNNYEFRLFRDYSSGKENNRHFYILTDENGISNMINLEPKKYWFRIEKDGKSNANTIINTDGALPDDINITTILDIGIQ